MIGELALITGFPRSATCTALTHVLTAEVSRDAFFNLLHRFPAAVLALLRELALRLYRAQGGAPGIEPAPAGT